MSLINKMNTGQPSGDSTPSQATQKQNLDINVCKEISVHLI